MTADITWRRPRSEWEDWTAYQAGKAVATVIKTGSKVGGWRWRVAGDAADAYSLAGAKEAAEHYVRKAEAKALK